ncbi:hypothetical protein Phum_PHUM540630 [Pediculus humanus corporis]|uniref:Uncharacterized protein n=1 Tax=Pediculus humanus subsp. corporis TaxID=121224 RepID=E0VZZ4_PEDHC|nr:uncharacterized protein Phum_PHUM540630 [Pediculus humanus corporis]EEB18950.1 hypothetical protein Phum_PHUM540630 [Pediculus humanus corporis]
MLSIKFYSIFDFPVAKIRREVSYVENDRFSVTDEQEKEEEENGLIKLSMNSRHLNERTQTS